MLLRDPLKNPKYPQISVLQKILDTSYLVTLPRSLKTLGNIWLGFSKRENNLRYDHDRLQCCSSSGSSSKCCCCCCCCCGCGCGCGGGCGCGCGCCCCCCCCGRGCGGCCCCCCLLFAIQQQPKRFPSKTTANLPKLYTWLLSI